MTAEPLNLLRRWVLVGLSASAARVGATSAPPPTFRVFDALLHRDKPNLRRYGLELLLAVDRGFWRKGESHETFDLVETALTLERVPTDSKTIFIDIEEWPVFQQPPQIRDASISRYQRIAELVRSERPGLQFGFYGVPPVCAYWPNVFRDASYQQWLEANRALAPVARAVDFLFPCFYTFYDDRHGWLDFATANLQEARRYSKPVYPFLWFQYFNGNEKLHDQDVAIEAWEEELRFCRAHADGVVLWGGAGQQWDDQAAWWRTARLVLNLSPG